MNLFLIFVFAVLYVSPLGDLQAQVPQLINYQGRVGVDGVNFDGSGQFKFAFVNAAGTTTYWSNDGSSTAGSEPATAVGIPVSKGLYSILLGDATQAHMTIVPATVFVHGDVHLRVWFSDGVKGFQQLTPDRRIAAVGYALMADSVSDGAITTAKIADGAVTSEKLAAGVVQTSNLATGAVGNTQLANSALTINAGTGLGGGGLVSLGGNVSLSNSGVLSLTSGGGITVDAATGVITLGSSATSANTDSTIVARDASGNFAAGTITAALNGNATTATDASNFTGMLAGEVTGTQAATAIAATTVTGKALTGFASTSGTVAATDSILSAINKIDGNTALKAPVASPTFAGSVTMPAGTATTAPIQLQTGTNLTTPTFGAVEFDGTNVFVTNNSANPTRKTIAFTDSTVTSTQIATGTVNSSHLASGLTLGGITIGIFSGGLTGNVTGNVSGSAASFTGSLIGDVTGTQGATFVAAVGTSTAANLHAAELAANSATNANTASTIVKRDASGNFSAGTITGALNGNATTATNATNFTGSLTGDVSGTQGATVVSMVGTSSAANVHAAELAANAATSANTPGTIMKRDANGDFSAGTIIASTFMGKGALPWVVVSGTSQQAEPNTGYLAANAAEVTITLPTSPAIGDLVCVTGAGSGGWRITQNAGQLIASSLLVQPAAAWVTRESSRSWTSVASSSDGTKLVASVSDGQLYTSSDSGVTWTPRATNKSWGAVATSADGTKLFALGNGQIHTSTDSGVTWVPRESVRNWSCVASSADGTKLVATVQGGKIYRSVDSGVNWSIAYVTDASWNSIASSADGTRLLASSGSSGFLYRSSDSAASWSILTGGDLGNNGRNWKTVNMSSSGDIMIAITESGGVGSVWVSTNAGSYWIERYKPLSVYNIACSFSGSTIIVPGLISRDSGQSWSPRDMPGSCFAMSADGSKIVSVGSQIYTSSTETTVGSSGYLRGLSSASIELQYIGNGRFLPLASLGALYPY
jgi:hypothetical protein